MNNSSIKMGLAIGITTLFIISCIIPMTIGFNSRDSDDNELELMFDNLRYVCTTPIGFNEVRYEYYKEQLLKQYSDDDLNDYGVIEDVEPIIYEQQAMSTMIGGPKDTPWPMKCHDLHHTSQSQYSTADNPYDMIWRFHTSSWIEDTPVIDSNGIIYFGCLNYYLYSVYPNGILKWKYKTGSNILGSSPAIAEDGSVYIGSWDGNLYAINPDGTLKWKFPTNGANIASSPIIGEDGTVYFGDLGDFGYNSKIYAVNPNGTEKWHYTINNRIYSDPAIGDDGTLKWRFKTGEFIKAPPSIADDGTIYIGSYDDYLYALYPNGTMKWKCKIGYGTALNPSIASDGTIYVGWDYLYAVNPNGTIKWSFNMGENRHIDTSSPAISADGTIYIGTNIGETSGGEIIAINPNGTEKWRKNIAKNWVESSPSIAEDGTVYIGSSYDTGRGYLQAFGFQETDESPNPPSISGPTHARAGVEYWYTFVAHDPDNNPIRLFVDWGDGVSGWVEWVDWFASGENMYAEHTWTTQGNYTIKAKVKDVFEEESDWSYLDVTMPKNKMNLLQSPFWYRVLERFPNAFPIIRHLFRV